MSEKTVINYEPTAFGPMETSRSVEYETCSKCNNLEAENKILINAIGVEMHNQCACDFGSSYNEGLPDCQCCGMYQALKKIKEMRDE